MSQVKLLIPRSVDEGRWSETVAIFAARRCRTTKTHDELMSEVLAYSEEKRASYLENVIFQDWAADVLEMIHLVYDWEDVPMWLLIELFRHRLIWRDFSAEQLSQRAISPMRLRVEAPNERMQVLVEEYVRMIQEELQKGKIPPEDLREIVPQGVLVNIVLGGNLRTFHHFFFMRSSPLLSGKGGAHRKFMALADQMQEQARLVLPLTMSTILKA